MVPHGCQVIDPTGRTTGARHPGQTIVSVVRSVIVSGRIWGIVHPKASSTRRMGSAWTDSQSPLHPHSRRRKGNRRRAVLKTSHRRGLELRLGPDMRSRYFFPLAPQASSLSIFNASSLTACAKTSASFIALSGSCSSLVSKAARATFRVGGDLG